MNYESEMEIAIKSDKPIKKLIEITIQYYNEDHSKNEIIQDVVNFMDKLRSLGKEEEEDMVLELYDYLIGYSNLKPPF